MTLWKLTIKWDQNHSYWIGIFGYSDAVKEGAVWCHMNFVNKTFFMPLGPTYQYKESWVKVTLEIAWKYKQNWIRPISVSVQIVEKMANTFVI